MVTKKPEVEEIEEARQKRRARLLALGEAVEAALAHRSGRSLVKLEEAVEEGRKLAKAPSIPTVDRPDLTEWDLRLVAIGRAAQAMGIPAADILSFDVQAEKRLRAKVDEDSTTPRPIPDPAFIRYEPWDPPDELVARWGEKCPRIHAVPKSVADGLRAAIDDAGFFALDSFRFRTMLRANLQALPDAEGKRVWKHLLDAIRRSEKVKGAIEENFLVFHAVRRLDPGRKNIKAALGQVAHDRGETVAETRRRWQEAILLLEGRQRVPAKRPSRRTPAI